MSARVIAEYALHDEQARTVILCAFARLRIDYPRSDAEMGRW